MNSLAENLQIDFRNKGFMITIESTIFDMPHKAEEAMKHTPPDIVLLDYYLSDINGKIVTCDAFLKTVTTCKPEAKVVIISGQSRKDTVERLKETGAAFYISKEPRVIHRIVPTLKMIIEKKLKKSDT